MIALLLLAATALPFDGSPWNLSTGNLSVTFIQASPIGAHPRPNYLEPPPSVESLKKLKEQGLVAYEDYIAWGAVEREPGRWDWTQHDAIEKAVHAAGLKYVAYCWVHFPPAWLRDDQKQNRTLMRCLEHDQETNYLSIFDPKTIEHYDHFYKALHDHFGDKLDGVYACILGPYGEGNYPLNVPDFVNIGHCHEGFWCGDEFARKQFPNPPWQGIELKTAEDRHRQYDFIKWYHQAIIDFAEKSMQTTLKYFPKEKVRTKPGGNAGGVNPIAWGTYCPGYAKMAAKYGIVLQPADWHGAYFGDKWVATAYHFYRVPLGTEPAGGLDHNGFVKRLFSDASCGTKQLFTYEFDQHAADIQKYARLVTGQPGDTEIAVLCPTTMYRLGADLSPTIHHASELRDLANFDVLDELLIADGALKFDRYKLLIVFQGDYIDQPILDRMTEFLHVGGQILVAGSDPIRNLDAIAWDSPASGNKPQYVGGNMMKQFKSIARGMLGYDGVEDHIWTTHRGRETIRLNTGDKAATVNGVTIPPHEMTDEAAKPDFISISSDKRGFVLSTTNAKFIPWGFNYDRDNDSHLLEDYWQAEWPRIVEDFGEMKQLGANVVRIHLQFGKFMDAPDRINEANFKQLERLLRVAHDSDLHLDLTGLACYRKQDVPAWYDALSESERWDAQARFWQEVARRCAQSSAVFCYDLMNEPVAPNDKQPDKQWLVNAPLAGFYFVQYIALDPAGRSRDQIFKAWVGRLTKAIRSEDTHHLITVGMLPFAPGEVAHDLDYLSVHVYPEKNKVDDALKIVKAFNGFDKPIVIEETFPLACSADQLGDFLKRSRNAGAAGWIGFYWGKTPAELKGSKNAGDMLTLAWLELFQQLNPNRPMTITTTRPTTAR